MKEESIDIIINDDLSDLDNVEISIKPNDEFNKKQNYKYIDK